MRVLSEDGVRGLKEEELIRRVVAEHQRVLEETSPPAAAWREILLAYRDKNPKAFAESITKFRKLQQAAGGTEISPFKAEFEVFYNNFAPFHQCSALYIFVLLLACASWVGYREVLNRSAFWLAVLALTLHTLALVGRMYIQSRPPVTNLYSSAVFIGWGCVVVGLFLEWYWRNGIGNVVAATTGALTVMVAHHLSESSGDTLEMMRAVLDTNFWLATHVTCITLGYSATFLAGFLGILFILIGLLTPRLDRELFRSLGSMIYGTLCFATLLSFVGTVLGGIWADQSWGRFWGWDPKENGALLIVLMNALILHARWAGLVKQRGMAILAVVGNMVVGWSWFGTNQLETGLHAYGFNNTLATGLMLFWASQLLIIGIGLIPTRHWMSFGQASPPPQEPAPGVPAPPRRSRRDPTAVTNRR
jgi:ABC-type transport system involved in cytochrome c biogenesis permease subunit